MTEFRTNGDWIRSLDNIQLAAFFSSMEAGHVTSTIDNILKSRPSRKCFLVNPTRFCNFVMILKWLNEKF